MCALKQLVTNINCCLIIVLLNASFACADWVFDDEGCLLPDGSSGNCMNIYECRPIIEYIGQIKTLSSDISKKLSNYYCGVDRGTVKVCCPYETIVFPRWEIEETPKQPPKTDQVLLPSDCGYFATEDNIVGGTKTSIFEFPWMALLGYEEGNEIKYKCAGTIINNYYILTAAHCLQQPDLPFVVRLGEHNLKTERDCETYFDNRTNCASPVQDINIEEIIPHPQFDLKLRNNDIALIRLASPINTSLDTVKPICLPITDSLRNRKYTNENFIVTGWGVTEKLIPSSELLKVYIPVINITQCLNTYRLLKVDIKEDKQFCVGGQRNKDSCIGDSGGPLQNIQEHEGTIKFVQYGIVSYGPSFCGKGLPGVYTRVDYYIDWILSKLKS